MNLREFNTVSLHLETPGVLFFLFSLLENITAAVFTQVLFSSTKSTVDLVD